MGSEVAKRFDAAEFREQVEGRIKAEFMSLLPDEMFTEMVKDAIQRLTTSRTEGPDYNRRHVPSEFEKMVSEALKEDVVKQVRAVLAKPEWTGNWEGVIGEAVEELVKKNAAQMVASVFGSAIQHAINNAKLYT